MASSIILALQATDTTVECGLFQPTIHNNGVICHTFHREPKKDASKNLIARINIMLTQSHLSLSDITLCAVNRGPSFFTTLRTVIATVNGLCMPRAIARIGISGFDACTAAYGPTIHNTTPVLFILDACSHDVYYVFMTSPDTAIRGCTSFSQLCVLIQTHIGVTTPFTCLGSSTLKYQHLLRDFFGESALINEPIIQTVPLETIAYRAYCAYQQDNPASFTEPIVPLYVKDPFLIQRTVGT